MLPMKLIDFLICGETNMSKNEFLVLCSAYSIDPDMALENDNVVEALRNRDDDAVATILESEF